MADGVGALREDKADNRVLQQQQLSCRKALLSQAMPAQPLAHRHLPWQLLLQMLQRRQQLVLLPLHSSVHWFGWTPNKMSAIANAHAPPPANHHFMPTDEEWNDTVQLVLVSIEGASSLLFLSVAS